MILKRWNVLAITALSLLGFLISAVLLTDYERIYHTLLTPQRLRNLCDGEEICSESTSYRATDNDSVALEDDVPLRKVYDALIKTGTSRKGGVKMNISLLSAFEHPDQIYVIMTSMNRYGNTIYCRYFNYKRKEIGSAFKAVVFPEYTANCLRREGATYISLTESADSSYEFPVPIIDRTQNVTTHYLSACLAPLHSAGPKWLTLAEFIEHHKIYGVKYFYIYIKDIDEYSRKLLDDYVRTGEVEVIVLHDRFVRKPKEWHGVELQDCLLRARGHSRWVTLIDMDERLITTEYNGTFSDYLRNISDPKIAEVSIRQRWILSNDTTPEKYIDKDQVAEFMPTLRYRNTSHVAPPGYTAKYFTDPKKAMIANIHAIDVFFDDYTRHYMKPEEAVIRHYRDVIADDWGKFWQKGVEDFGDFSMTDYPEAQMKILKENIQRRLHHVYGGMQ